MWSGKFISSTFSLPGGFILMEGTLSVDIESREVRLIYEGHYQNGQILIGHWSEDLKKKRWILVFDTFTMKLSIKSKTDTEIKGSYTTDKIKDSGFYKLKSIL